MAGSGAQIKRSFRSSKVIAREGSKSFSASRVKELRKAV